MPGRIANVWPPRLVAGEPTGTAERLLSWSDTLLRRAGVRLAQVLLRSSRGGDASLLVRHGYRFTAELLYLVCEVTAAADVASDHELVFTACGEQDRQRLLRVITATYDGTQDIPALNGLRSPEDVLDGYAHPGADATPHWFLVTHHSDDAGCLLLCDYPAAAQLELVYMGLVPAARGRGWGADIVRFTQYSALATQRTRVVLAVDAANDPALVTYGRAGFFEWDRRSLFLKVLS
jgi:GNAT superfamily N-acetyltransferase